MKHHAYPPFKRAAVLGAGVMGAQIAAHLANAGLNVHLLDIPAEGENRNAVVEKQFSKLKKMSPEPFFTRKDADRIALGNFDDHFDRLKDVDWIVEAVIEKLDVKRELMERLEATAAPETVISTNTSGLPIHQISEGRSDSFRRRFLGTHFFNPPRYLKLLELIPSPETDPEIIERLSWFARIYLGKGVVVAKDTPAFIANRIGTYALIQHIRMMTEGGYSIEEVDTLTGQLTGRPKSATFRTADLVGLDTLVHVAENLHGAIPEDESREAFSVPEVVKQLVSNSALGAKTGAGFYKKVDSEILSINPETLEYEPPRKNELGDISELKQIHPLDNRLRTLFRQQDRAGEFFRRTTLDVLSYAARRIPEIADNPADVDRAIRWGFGWQLGPFELWDAVGFDLVLDEMRRRRLKLPTWIDEMQAADANRFYRGRGTAREVFVPGSGYQPEPVPKDEIRLSDIKSNGREVIWEDNEAALLDIGEGVALFEFRSMANTLSRGVLNSLMAVMDVIESRADIRGMVIGNEGENFSVGANLGEVIVAVKQRLFDPVEAMVCTFQQAMQRIHYCFKPVVVAIQGRVLGGGCEMAMACTHPVAAAESYVGLVELGVGLIPAGCGTMRMARRAYENAASDHPSNIQPHLRRAFETVAMAEVALSAPAAIDFGYLARHARVIMNSDRRIYAAKEDVIRLSNQGHIPPPRGRDIMVLGRAGRAQFEQAVYNMRQSRFISEYDRLLANRLAYVMTGGELTGPAMVSEQYLMDLEREVFMSLIGEEKTQDRIVYMLKNRKPLRN